MSMQSTKIADDQRIDELVRRHHAASVGALSPKVRAQLVQRRHAAGRGQSVHRGPALRAGVAAFATLCALAIGLPLRRRPYHGEGDAVRATAAVSPPDAQRRQMLDEDPSSSWWHRRCAAGRHGVMQ